MLSQLVNNIRYLTRNNPVMNPFKGDHFDRKWGVCAAFSKNINKGSYDTFEDSSDTFKNLINDQILVKYKTQLSDDRSTFLNTVAKESLAFVASRREEMEKSHYAEALRNHSMAMLMEHIFEILKAYSYELNNAVGFSPLHIASTNPQLVTEVIKFNKMRQAEEKISYHRARLSTSVCSLVLRGDKNGIQFFILPVSRAIGLAKQESLYQPIISLVPQVDPETDKVIWHSNEGILLSSSSVEFICMELFKRLVDETKRQVQDEMAPVWMPATC